MFSYLKMVLQAYEFTCGIFDLFTLKSLSAFRIILSTEQIYLVKL